MVRPMPTWERNSKSYFTEENVDEILQSHILMGWLWRNSSEVWRKFLRNWSEYAYFNTSLSAPFC